MAIILLSMFFHMNLVCMESYQGKKVVIMEGCLMGTLTISGFTVGGVELPECLGIKLCWLYLLPNNPTPCESG